MNIPERATASGVIYVTENLTNGKIYVGLDTKKAPGYLGSGVVLQRAIRKYGRAAFCRHDVDSFRSAAEGFLREQFWIRKLHSRSDTGWGYNLTDGGEGTMGRQASPETRRKLSAAHKGKRLSPEHCRKMSEDRKGRKHSSETRRKISEAGKGYKHTEEARRKISEAQKHTPHPKGRKHSVEARRKMSVAQKGRKRTDEQRLRISASKTGEKNPNFGRVLTEETKRKMSEAQKGRKISEEHKRKIGAAHKGKPWSPERHAAWTQHVKSAGLENQANA